jgi:hypothetical protein
MSRRVGWAWVKLRMGRVNFSNHRIYSRKVPIKASRLTARQRRKKAQPIAPRLSIRT